MAFRISKDGKEIKIKGTWVTEHQLGLAVVLYEFCGKVVETNIREQGNMIVPRSIVNEDS